MIGKFRLTIGSWSMFGQTALLIIAALLLAQFFAFFLTRNVIDQWHNSNVVEPAIRHFAEAAGKITHAPPGMRPSVISSLQREDEHYLLVPQLNYEPGSREYNTEQALRDTLKEHSVSATAVVVSRGGGFGAFRPMPFEDPRSRAFGEPQPDRPFGEDTPQPDRARSPGERGVPPAEVSGPSPRFGGPPPGRANGGVRLAARLDDGRWLVGFYPGIRPFPMLLNPLILSQIALFVILLAATLFWASRISRPLRILARAAEALRPQEQFESIPVRGSREVRVAIESFNTMAQRVRDLLSEKDRMLSAIGHDLRTPLAALRIRTESIEPENEREKIVETIDEMTAMVEEILAFSRLGHSTEPRQLVDLSALADSVVEEFHSLGKKVEFIEAPRVTGRVQVNLVRRLLRNLVDNAIKYGERATVSVRNTAGAVELLVEDEGPGIPPERLGEVMQPFTRLDSSRNRGTGGTGLGLSIADAIAKSQGAVLILENREPGGLRAIVRWPTQPAQQYA